MEGGGMDGQGECLVPEHRILPLPVDCHGDGPFGTHYFAHAAQHAFCKVYVHGWPPAEPGLIYDIEAVFPLPGAYIRHKAILQPGEEHICASCIEGSCARRCIETGATRLMASEADYSGLLSPFCPVRIKE